MIRYVSTLISSLAVLCAQFCELDSLLALRIVNKHWLYSIFAQKAAFKHFVFNDTWKNRISTLIHHKQWHSDGCVFRHISAFMRHIYQKKDLDIFDSFHHLLRAKLVIDSVTWSGKYSLPSSLRYLSLSIETAKDLSCLSWQNTFPFLEKFRLYFNNSVLETDFFVLDEILAHLVALKILNIHFKKNTFPKVLMLHFIRLLTSLPQLESMSTNLRCEVTEIASMQKALPECRMIFHSVKEHEAWYKEIIEYLNTNPSAQTTLQFSLPFSSVCKFQGVLDECSRKGICCSSKIKTYGSRNFFSSTPHNY